MNSHNSNVLASTSIGRPNDPSGRSRFLSQPECEALVKRAIQFGVGGGDTTVMLQSSWTGNFRWGRNQVSSAGDVRDNEIRVARTVRGASGASVINQIDDEHVLTAVRRAERVMQTRPEQPAEDQTEPYIQPYLHPKIWSDATYNLTAADRAAKMQEIIAPVVKAGMVAAGYMEVSAHARLTMNQDRVWYYPYTIAQFSMTVRDPKGTASGWAGVDQNDWALIDAKKLADTALEKCVRSQNPVRFEPGRYTTILEPQAVCDLTKLLFIPKTLDRAKAEEGQYRGDIPTPANSTSIYNQGPGLSRIGRRIMDERLSISSDPTDPELGFPPFFRWDTFHPVTWVKDGVLKELVYSREYAVKVLSQDTGGVNATGSYRMSVKGPTTSMEEMIATTKRGILVTRFWGIPPIPIDPVSFLTTGYTRDGLWLIEDGKISKAIKNFKFTESPIIVLNNIEQIGVPQRVFRPDAPIPFDNGYAPVIVPALKVRDFNFTSLSDAV